MKKLRAWTLAGLILAFPFALVSFEDTYFHDDVLKFSQWGVAHNLSSTRDLYRVCGTCNYPIAGVLSSGGVIARLQALEPSAPPRAIHMRFRYYLAGVDAAMGLATVLLLVLAGIAAPLAVGTAIFMSPSSWAGTAIWGQIEGVTQLLLLLSAAGLIALLRETDARSQVRSGIRRHQAPLLLWAAGLCAVAALFMKQLALFSMPALALLWLLGAARLWRAGHRAGVLAAGALVLILLLRVDFYFNLPGDWNSHLSYILFGGGSDHGHKIGGNGFNLWVLLGRPQSASSDVAFLGPLTPRYTGLALFLIWNACAYLAFTYRLFGAWNGGWSETKQDARGAGILLLLLMGLSHLAFNVFMPGTHERHLYHFFPFAIVALVYYYRNGSAPAWLVGWVGIMGIVYGLFVFLVLHGRQIFPLSSPVFLAVLHAALLVYLTVFYSRRLKETFG